MHEPHLARTIDDDDKLEEAASLRDEAFEAGADIAEISGKLVLGESLDLLVSFASPASPTAPT